MTTYTYNGCDNNGQPSYKNTTTGEVVTLEYLLSAIKLAREEFEFSLKQAKKELQEGFVSIIPLATSADD